VKGGVKGERLRIMIRVERERGGERWSKRRRIKNYDQI